MDNYNKKLKRRLKELIDNFRFELTTTEILSQLYFVIAEELLEERIKIGNEKAEDYRKRKVLLLEMLIRIENGKALEVEVVSEFIK